MNGLGHISGLYFKGWCAEGFRIQASELSRPRCPSTCFIYGSRIATMGRSAPLRATSQASTSRSDVSSSKQKRQASVYDAVAGTHLPHRQNALLPILILAGRVSSTGFLPETPFASKNRDTASSSTVPIPPEEVLFRRSKAPERYEEDDFYWADRHLTEEQKLPDSDLLKAIHMYASDFYSRATVNRGQVDFSSMDGSALLALGILLEEAAEDVLGATGDMVFIEGEKEDDRVVEDFPEGPSRVRETSAAARKSGDTRRGKRRKTKHVSGDNE